MAKGGKRKGAGRKKGSFATHTLQAQEARKLLVAKYIKEQTGIDQALIDKAKTGDVPAIKELYDRVYGKSNESLDVTSLGEKLSIDDKQLDQLIRARTARTDNNKSSK